MAFEPVVIFGLMGVKIVENDMDFAAGMCGAGLRAHIEAFIAGYNETARPFVWQKSQVHQKRLKPRFADQ